MKSEYYVVKSSALPDYFGKVLEAKELLRSGEVREISEAVRRVGISRSTFYKYKDCVYRPSEGDMGKKAVISMILRHEPGLLGRVLSFLGDRGANILTITQNPPIASRASVVISIDVSSMKAGPDELITALEELDGVEYPRLIDIA